MKNLKIEKRKLLRLFTSESDRWDGKPLYLAIIELCRDRDISGVTVLRGVAGYGIHKKVHTDKILTLSGDLPLLVEIILYEEQVTEIVTATQEMFDGGLITMEDIEVVCSK
jgi:PII-like signaling protein